MDKIPVKTVNWMQSNDFMLISNGVDAIAYHDATDKQATVEIQKPSFAIYHKGKVFTDKDLSNFNPEEPTHDS